MGTPFQQRALNRKLIYIGLILVLFTASLVWRRYVMDEEARALAIREQSRGDVDLTSALVRLSLVGSRGVLTCALWNSAMDKQKKNQWSELELMVRSLTKLQPHFITPWLFQSWNLAYNVSVELDRPGDKYFYIARGIGLLAEGDRQNHHHPDIRWSVGFFTQHKIAQSDDTNVLRSIFQLSYIPPNDRDPARFEKLNDKGQAEFNGQEFEQFCKDYPHLVRRLRIGMRRETEREQRRQFVCERPEDVVQFLKENKDLPSLYVSEGTGEAWKPGRPANLRPPADRFPVLPPPWPRAESEGALTDDPARFPLRDDEDAYTVSGAWYSYAQEPIPDPDWLPGSTKEIEDPARQRKPRYMTTAIFRDHPAQAARYHGECLEEEGWFDDKGWDIPPGWFDEQGDKFSDGKPANVGAGRFWARDGWRRALDKWEDYGDRNHMELSPEVQRNFEQQADAFRQKFGLKPGAPAPDIREEELNPVDRGNFQAVRFLWEYNYYRGLTNFPHHLNQARVESEDVTIKARKLFYEAERLMLAGSRDRALEKLSDPDALQAWRDKVLLGNDAYRQDSINQEFAYVMELKYLDLYNQIYGRQLKEKLAKLAPLVPLLPKVQPDFFPRTITAGPLDVEVKKGEPLISPGVVEQVLSRLNRLPQKAPTPLPAGPPGPGRPERQPQLPPKP